jgi:hypothetical protein
VLCAALVPATANAASSLDEAAKNDLVNLYVMSIAADRCGFAMTTRQADTLERATQMLAHRLKLRPRQNDALYSEADVRFEQYGHEACDRSSDFAKGFRQTLKTLTGR